MLCHMIDNHSLPPEISSAWRMIDNNATLTCLWNECDIGQITFDQIVHLQHFHRRKTSYCLVYWYTLPDIPDPNARSTDAPSTAAPATTSPATAAPSTAAPSTAYCREGYSTYNGSCYAFFTIATSATDAEAWCEASGSHLVTIADQDEFDFVKTLV